MNEIQAVKTAKIEEVKKNSKKGFTLVELVVVIAILAILAAIAIPVVSSTIQSSQRSSALSNAQTLELAIKEAHAQVIAKDYSVYAPASGKTTVELSDVTVATIETKKAIKIDPTVTIGGKKYTLMWSKTDSKCYYVTSATSGSLTTNTGLDTSVTLPTDVKALNTTDTLNALF